MLKYFTDRLYVLFKLVNTRVVGLWSGHRRALNVIYILVLSILVEPLIS